MTDFRNKFGNYSGTSKEKITCFWQELILSETSKKLSDLVKGSKELPEIIVLQVWERSWYDSMKKIFIPTFQKNEANVAFNGCQFSIELATNKINRRVGGTVIKSCGIEQLTMLGETVSIHQFSHAMFLLKLLKKHGDVELKF